MPNLKNKADSLGDLLRFWRQLKRKSQMDLALDVGISSRHLSFVETGRSRPSRTLVLKLAHALKLPLRHQNLFLKTAGYAPEFGQEPFDGQKMEIIRQALKRMITNHEPFPALVIDAAYQILMTNSGFDRMITFFLGETALHKYNNVYRMTFAPDGLRRYIQDWPVIARFMLVRLWEEALSTQNKDLFDLYEEVSKLETNEFPELFEMDTNLPMLTLTLTKESVTACFFTTVTMLATPADQTTQELRIESLFPVDEQTRRLFTIESILKAIRLSE